MAKEAPNPTLIDKRVVERNIKKGLITRDAYEKHLTTLPDVAAQSEKIRAKLLDDDEADVEEGEGDDEEDKS